MKKWEAICTPKRGKTIGGIEVVPFLEKAKAFWSLRSRTIFSSDEK